MVLTELGPQDYFGEMALLADRPRAATVIAATDCLLGVLAKEQFLAALAEQPEVSLTVIQVLSDRLVEANDRLVAERGEDPPAARRPPRPRGPSGRPPTAAPG